MNKFLVFIVSIVLFSCSNNDNEINQKETEVNELEINYLSYAESLTYGRSTRLLFNNFEINSITEQTSTTEQIKLLNIVAKRDDSSDYIEFTVISGVLGIEALYNKHFKFIERWPTYNVRPNFNFNVIKNDEIEFIANFSGDLEHWNENTQLLQVIKVNYGTVKINL